MGDSTDTVFDEALQRVRRTAERYGRREGVALQPDDAVREYVLRGLARNVVEHGRPYCPCREVTGEAEQDRANICPCRTHTDEIARMGECECGLYVAEDTVERE